MTATKSKASFEATKSPKSAQSTESAMSSQSPGLFTSSETEAAPEPSKKVGTIQPIQSAESAESAEQSKPTEPSQTSETAPPTPSAVEEPPTEEVKASRPKQTAKQLKADLDAYCEYFFSPVKVEKEDKHQPNLTGATFNRAARIVRIFGGDESTVSSYIEHIVNAHIEANKERLAAWLPLLGKTL